MSIATAGTYAVNPELHRIQVWSSAFAFSNYRFFLIFLNSQTRIARIWRANTAPRFVVPLGSKSNELRRMLVLAQSYVEPWPPSCAICGRAFGSSWSENPPHHAGNEGDSIARAGADQLETIAMQLNTTRYSSVPPSREDILSNANAGCCNLWYKLLPNCKELITIFDRRRILRVCKLRLRCPRYGLSCSTAAQLVHCTCTRSIVLMSGGLQTSHCNRQQLAYLNVSFKKE